MSSTTVGKGQKDSYMGGAAGDTVGMSQRCHGYSEIDWEHR